jgi:regulator of replication initiation timing
MSFEHDLDCLDVHIAEIYVSIHHIDEKIRNLTRVLDDIKKKVAELMKYDTRDKIRHDKNQTILTPEGITDNPLSNAEISVQLNPEQFLICPFCLISNKTYKFIQKEHNKFMAKCPNCGQLVQFKTLLSMLNWTGSQFADFVFPYGKMGFWSKIYPDFDHWKKQLSDLRQTDSNEKSFAQSFWDRYKTLKGDYDEEDNYSQVRDEY